MGKLFKAKCFHCGYETGTLHQGGGMADLQHTNRHPVLNRETNQVETANLKQRDEIQKENPRIMFYDEDSLSRVYKRYTYKINDDKFIKKENVRLYVCPKCYRFEMDFLWLGLYD